MQHILEGLSEEQLRAVQHASGPLLVIAGAGSGKTRVITRRIAWLLVNGVPDYALLGVTFTNKAAKEMAGRVRQLVPESRIRLSTFHSACAAFLRRSAPLLGFDHDFTIYDTQDRDQLLKALMSDRGISPKEIRPSIIGSRISKLKNDGIRAGDFVPEAQTAIDRYVGRLYVPYQEALARMNAMDFDDLLLHFLRLLEEHEAERERYARRFEHVLVDEFQDTNKIQYDIVRLLASHHGNLCVVGDPDQSIYSFRGANIGNILSFPEDYPGTEVVKLETNYRSSATILELAQKVISHNRYRFDKELKPGLGHGDPVELQVCDTGRDEARRVASRASRLIEQGTSASEIAVFYRARFMTRLLEESFRTLRVPHEIVGDVGFFGRKEIKDLIAFLNVTVNLRDRISLRRILNTPPRGIGKVSVEKLAAEAERRGMGEAELILAREVIPGLAKRTAHGLSELADLLAEARELAPTSVRDTLEMFLERSDYLEHVCRSGGVTDADREENVYELLVHAAAFDHEFREQAVFGQDHVDHAVRGYLQQVTLATDTYAEKNDAAVQMMTVHAAKGLEFDHVFLVGLEDGVFPHSRCQDSVAELEEERRLFYVAVTRARKTLTVMRAAMRDSYDSGPRSTRPSRFLVEAELAPSRRASPQFDDDGERIYHYEQVPAGLGEETATQIAGFAAGQRVRHPTYGEGTIRRCTGTGRSAKAEVLFRSGVRVLLLEYAKLENIGEQ